MVYGTLWNFLCPFKISKIKLLHFALWRDTFCSGLRKWTLSSSNFHSNWCESFCGLHWTWFFHVSGIDNFRDDAGFHPGESVYFFRGKLYTCQENVNTHYTAFSLKKTQTMYIWKTKTQIQKLCQLNLKWVKFIYLFYFSPPTTSDTKWIDCGGCQSELWIYRTFRTNMICIKMVIYKCCLHAGNSGLQIACSLPLPKLSPATFTERFIFFH